MFKKDQNPQSAELEKAAREYLKAAADAKQAAARRDAAAGRIRAALATMGVDKAVTKSARVTLSTYEQTTLDREKLKAEMPSIFDIYAQQKQQQRLTVKALG